MQNQWMDGTYICIETVDKRIDYAMDTSEAHQVTAQASKRG